MNFVPRFLLVCAVGILAALWAGLCISWWLALAIVLLPVVGVLAFALMLRFVLGLAAASPVPYRG